MNTLTSLATGLGVVGFTAQAGDGANKLYVTQTNPFTVL